MSTEKPILEQAEIPHQLATELAQDVELSNLQKRARNRIDSVLASVSDNLRATSATTNELMKRSLDTVYQTSKMVAYSKEAIAQSRALLVGRKDLS